jgi:hypothetical protein
MISASRLIVTFLLVICFHAAPLASAADTSRLRPKRFAIIFNMGYAGDPFPQDDGGFEKVLQTIKQAHYNVILCKHTPSREKLCKKHDILMMVDLLVPAHHIYKNPDGAKTLCESLRDSKIIYGYHLWSDRIGGAVAGRNRDVANVKKWDPHHAVYVGSYHARALDGLKQPDLVGYYDFHWKRGGLWRYLNRTLVAAKKTDSYFLKYTDGAPGKIGVGNYNRVLYTVSQSIAFGLKGYLFHHTGQEIDKKTWQWKQLGKHLTKVNAQVASMGFELVKLGNPSAVYATPMTKTAKDRPASEDGSASLPADLKPIPKDAGFTITTGEAVVGVFTNPNGFKTLIISNHNAYQEQAMKIKWMGTVENTEQFNRASGKWETLKVDDGTVQFTIAPASFELVQIKQ